MKSTDALELLRKWKPLPNYRAEPRVDYIISLALPSLIKDKFNSNIVCIIPELPLRIGSLYEKYNTIDKSFKVDYYLLLENGQNIFVEMKTDSGSRRDKQDKYLEAARSIKMKAILNGIIKINEVTSYKSKYGRLINLLIEAGLITNDLKVSNKNDDIEVIYIQPKSDNATNTYGFNEISKYFELSGDNFLESFSKLLLEWSNEVV